MESSTIPAAVSERPIPVPPVVLLQQPEPGSHLFILSFKTEDKQEGTAYMNVRLTPGATRHEVYEWIVATMAKQLGQKSVITTFFSLEPNQIPGV